VPQKAEYVGPAESLSLYEALVAGNPDAERKGVTTPYTSRNGHMFSFLDPEGMMALRLPAAARDEFFARYTSALVEQHGRVMKEYVAVSKDLLRETAELQPWFDQSYEWIGTLKPKPTARPQGQ
jgi:hypothetical protein